MLHNTSLSKKLSPSVSSMTFVDTCLISSLNSVNWELSVVNWVVIFVEMDVSALYNIVKSIGPRFGSNMATCGSDMAIIAEIGEVALGCFPLTVGESEKPS